MPRDPAPAGFPDAPRAGSADLSEVPFRGVLDGMLEGVALLDSEFRFRYLNDAAARNLGATREALFGSSIFAHCPWLRGTPLHERFMACATNGRADRFDAPFPTIGGTIRWFEFSVQPSAGGLAVLSLDVTERHAAAVADARLRDVLASISLTAIILDPEGRLTFGNRALWDATGWTADQMLGADWFASFIPEDARPALRSLFREVVAAGEVPRQHEYQIVTRDGRRRTVVWSNVLLKDGAGAVTAVAAIGDDVTDRRAAEAAVRADLERAASELRKSEARLRGIVEGVDAIVAFQERVGTNLELSPQVGRVLGWAPEQIPDFETWHSLVHPDDRPRCMAVWERGPASWQLEYRIRHAQGHYVWVLDRGRLIPQGTGPGDGMSGIVVDVTERHEAAEALHASAERVRRIVEGMDGIVWSQEADGVPVLSSPQTERILGYSPETASSFAFWRSIVHPDDLPRAVAAWDGDGPGWDMDYRLRRADGTWVWVNDRARRIQRADGRGTDVVGFITDVTPQREAADRLRASEARFRAVADSAADAIVTIDDAGRIVSWNPSAERLFGVGADGLRDRPVTLLMPAARIPGHEAYAHRLGQDDGGPIAGHLTQLEGRRADGSVFPVELSLAAWTLDGKRYATAIVRDVTERRNAEEAVRVSAAFQRGVLDTMAEGLLVVGPSGRIASANVRASQVLGIEPERLVGSRIGEGWHLLTADGAELDPRDGPAQTALGTGEPRRDVELSVLRPDGNRVWLRINSEPLRDRDGTVVASVSTFSDITAERALAEQLRHSQRLEAVGRLAGGVAHDFNNLLAAIRGYGELALSSLPAESQATADVGEVLRAADRAAALTRQLLLFSRRQALAPRPVDAADVVDGLIPMLRQLVGEHITLEATRDAPGTVVRADPGQLEQVILNLVVNARDAMPDGGRIDVTTRRVEPDDPVAAPGARPAWPAVRITVADTGQGIDPMVLPHIFEPFYTTKEAGRGSGMGLATVYGIIGAFGGTVSVATSPGRGSTFTVDLPRLESPAAGEQAGMAAEAAGPAPAAGRQGTVLLVEDDAAVRVILARQLEGLGWRVEAHPSGTAAAAAVAVGNQARPDLVVTDVRMPGLQGPELARRLRAVWPELPVLFITGLADEVDVEPRSPRAHVLTKPFSRDALARAIDQAVGMPG